VKRAEPFDGSFPNMGLPVAASSQSQVHKRFAASLNAARTRPSKSRIYSVTIFSHCLVFAHFLIYGLCKHIFINSLNFLVVFLADLDSDVLRSIF
jgi:hypothetical protein